MQQKEFCLKNGCEFLDSPPSSILGFAVETRGKIPVNGLRQLPAGSTNGWYIWCGEEFSYEANFFSPLHASHLETYCPEVTKFLGLAPGFRFLFAENYLDIWFDSALLLK